MRYFHYKLFKLLLIVPTNVTPAFNAMLILITIQLSNLFSFFNIFKSYSGIDLYHIHYVAIYLFLFLINYLYIYRYRKETQRKYQNESKIRRHIGSLAFGVYVIASIVVFVKTK
ncbi:hypothetical protein LX69_02337 [Breznakibacter xylanolyticus]|uniref:Uncharacterized protein n=1 Tax=Breznakibacter xylanolyticus TaxID=990 RepID=A0A2W7NAA1_9BACT|nr:hypothetical protein LX69_02337 [Breznakibacter xylanolyticus]